MLCNQCPRPALRRYALEGGQVDLCLHCANVFESMLSSENDRLARVMNFSIDMMDDTIGLPRSGPRMQLRKPVVQISGDTVNNIHMQGASVGIVNTGSIESLNSSMTVIRDAGNADLAQAIKELTEAFAADESLDDEKRQEAVEILSAISLEATAEKAERKTLMVKRLLGSLAEIAKVGNAVGGIWDKLGPIITSAFHQ